MTRSPAEAASDEALKKKRQRQEENTLSPVQAMQFTGTLARALARDIRIMMRCWRGAVALRRDAAATQQGTLAQSVRQARARRATATCKTGVSMTHSMT